jgi:hypothetical protein
METGHEIDVENLWSQLYEANTGISTFSVFLYSEKQLCLIKSVVYVWRQAKDVATWSLGAMGPRRCRVTIAKRASAEATQTLRAV